MVPCAGRPNTARPAGARRRLELLTGGALATGHGVQAGGSPVTLELPADLAGREVELVDPEGLPLARLAPTAPSRAHARAARAVPSAPPATRAGLRRHAGATFVPVVDALTDNERSKRLSRLDTPVVLLALTGPGAPTLPVALLPGSGGRRAACRTPPWSPYRWPRTVTRSSTTISGCMVAAYAGPTRCWRSGTTATTPPTSPRSSRRTGRARPSGAHALPHRALREREVDGRPGGHRRPARRGERLVTSLDGDVVRRNLSAG